MDFFELLELFPLMGSVEVADKNIRGFQLTRQTRVFYRINKDRIIILSFFVVKRNPRRRLG